MTAQLAQTGFYYGPGRIGWGLDPSYPNFFRTKEATLMKGKIMSGNRFSAGNRCCTD